MWKHCLLSLYLGNELMLIDTETFPSCETPMAPIVVQLVPAQLNPVISVTEVILARAPRALEGEVKGGVASRGAGRGGCGVKVAVRG